MKWTSLIIFLLIQSTSLSVFSQADQIKVLEKQVKNENKSSYIRTATKLATLHMQQQNYDKGVKWLKNAQKEAKKSGVNAQIAQVNTTITKLILENAPKEKKYLEEAYKAIKTSLDQNIPELKTANVDLLTQLQAYSTDAKLTQYINESLASIEQKQEKQKLKEFKKLDDDVVFEEYNKLSEEREELEGVVDKLSEERKELTIVYRKSGEQIRQTTSELKKARTSLDSARIVNDSLLLANLQALNDKQKQELELQGQRLANQELSANNDRQKAQRNYLFGAAIFVFLVSLFLYIRYQTSRKQNLVLETKNEIIELERDKSEKLLLNILPLKVANELKEHGKVKTQFFESATVLFADFVKFSKIAATVSPDKLIADLDYCFTKFDEIVESFGIERIKTIGDAYMCVSGVPNPIKDHASRMVQAAKEMQAFLEIWNASRKADGLPEFNSRIGIHSGPLIAGVVGTSKFAYDIWGDTVNIADRMQDSGESGEINISKATQKLLNGAFELEFRGKLQIKNMADMEGYFVRV